MKTYTVHKDYLIIRCQQRGYLLEDVMPCVIKQDGDIWVVDVDHPAYPKPKEENYDHPSYKKIDDAEMYEKLGKGVGTELKKILSWFNINSSPNCSCNRKAKYMNDKGVEWCKNNIDTIVAWLKEEAEKRHLPFFAYAAKKIIKIAIYRAEKG